jgi:hypothetical protein
MRQTLAWGTAGVAAAAVAAVLFTVGAATAEPGRPNAVVAVAQNAVQEPPAEEIDVDLDDVTYTESDGMVTAWANGKKVASFPVGTWEWSGSAPETGVEVDATEEVVLDPGSFDPGELPINKD